MSKHRRKIIQHNSDMVERYVLKVVPKIERTGGIPDLPMDRKRKGESNSPVSGGVLDIWDANGQASVWINHRIKELEDSRTERRGYSATDLLSAAREDPGSPRNWAGQKWRAFEDFCELVAYSIMADLGEVRIHIHARAEDEPERAKTHQAYNEERRIDREESLRRIHERWQKTKAERGVGSEEAKRIMHNEWPYTHPKRVEEAITHVNRDNGDGGEAA